MPPEHGALGAPCPGSPRAAPRRWLGRDRLPAGVVTERRPLGEAVDLVVDVAGVGYRLVVAPGTASELQLGQEATLAVHTHVRESAITLYGFGSAEERTAFELLLGAHGVGPGLALAILSIHAPAELAQVIASGQRRGLEARPRGRAEDGRPAVAGAAGAL